MLYTLMHKNTEVADTEIDSHSGAVHKIIEVKNYAHLPVGTTINFGQDVGKPRHDWFNDWWLERSIPASRVGLKAALAELGISSSALLLEKCKGLSLSDQYWIKPQGSNLTWEEVNFFTNDFSSDVGEILFGRKLTNPNDVNLVSPDNTSVGIRRKRWLIADGKRFLLKGSEGAFKQEPHNEVIASEIMRRLGINHTDYGIVFENEKPFSICENFVTPNTELITAYRVMESTRKRDGDSKLAHLLHCCEQLGMADVTLDMYKMIVVDYLIANQDRHNTNYGFIRDAESLEWIGVAPIFDCGASLWYDTVEVGAEVECMPFRETHDEQIKLVNDFTWLDLRGLQEVDRLIVDMLSDCHTVELTRAKAIGREVKARVQIVEQLAQGKSLYQIKGQSRKTHQQSRPYGQQSLMAQVQEGLRIVEERKKSSPRITTKITDPNIGR